MTLVSTTPFMNDYSTHQKCKTQKMKDRQTERNCHKIEITSFSSRKETHRYICNEKKEVICLDGYREPEDSDEIDLRVYS